MRKAFSNLALFLWIDAGEVNVILLHYVSANYTIYHVEKTAVNLLKERY